MSTLELKVPPPVVGLAIAGAMWGLARMTPSLHIAVPGSTVLAAILILAGVSLAMSGKIAFGRARTTINPFKPEQTSALVVSGIYRFTRNPMYLGMLLDLTGIAVYFSNPVTLALLPVYVLYLNRFQIGPEEKILSGMFGQVFTEYAARVRRWI